MHTARAAGRWRACTLLAMRKTPFLREKQGQRYPLPLRPWSDPRAARSPGQSGYIILYYALSAGRHRLLRTATTTNGSSGSSSSGGNDDDSGTGAAAERRVAQSDGAVADRRLRRRRCWSLGGHAGCRKQEAGLRNALALFFRGAQRANGQDDPRLVRVSLRREAGF